MISFTPLSFYTVSLNLRAIVDNYPLFWLEASI